MLSPEDLLRSLRQRGVARIREVRLKNNRTRLLSVSRDGATLHAHAAYAAAPGEVLDAIAAFLLHEPGRAAHRRAVRVLREWPGAAEGLRSSGASAARRAPRPGPCCATPAQRAFLRELYSRLNRARFGGRLPADLPVRLSSRMRRRYGHVRLARDEAGAPRVVELALNAQLLHEANEAQLLDTMLHEMAHVEAWLAHGHRGHGAPWKRVCERVGCEPRACTTSRLPVRGALPRRVPALPAEAA